jgi:hypothetical protein
VAGHCAFSIGCIREFSGECREVKSDNHPSTSTASPSDGRGLRDPDRPVFQAAEFRDRFLCWPGFRDVARPGRCWRSAAVIGPFLKIECRPIPFLCDRRKQACGCGMRHRATRWRHDRWAKIVIHPHRDRAKVAALKADLVRAFLAGDIETYWNLDRELRWVLTQAVEGAPGKETV